MYIRTYICIHNYDNMQTEVSLGNTNGTRKKISFGLKKVSIMCKNMQRL